MWKWGRRIEKARGIEGLEAVEMGSAALRVGLEGGHGVGGGEGSGGMARAVGTLGEMGRGELGYGRKAGRGVLGGRGKARVGAERRDEGEIRGRGGGVQGAQRGSGVSGEEGWVRVLGDRGRGRGRVGRGGGGEGKGRGRGRGDGMV